MYRGVAGVGLDELAQSRHLHVDRAVEHLVVTAAREQHQLFARKRLPRMAREHLDQRKLSGRERLHLAVALERARGQIELCPPNGIRPSLVGAPGAGRSPWRRRTAWMRATSSRGLKGFGR